MDDEREQDRNGASRPFLLLRGVPRPTGSWIRLLIPSEMPREGVVRRLVLAVALTVGLWVGVSSAEDPVLTKVYPVRVTAQYPAQYYPVNGLPTVRVHVQALTSDLKDAPAPRASVDLRHVSRVSNVPVPVSVSGLPDGIKRVSVDPPMVTVPLETVLRRAIPVLLSPQGQPPLGYLPPSLSRTPMTVTITGPRPVVRAVDAARVLIDQSTLTHDASLQVAPRLFDRTGREVRPSVVSINPSTVTVIAKVQSRPVQQIVPVVAAITGTVAPGYSISRIAIIPSQVQVISRSQLPLTTTVTTPLIHVNGLTTNYTGLKSLILPGGVSLAPQAPALITVEIDVAPIPGSAVTTAQLLVVGQRPRTRLRLDRRTLTVIYQGALPRLQNAHAPRAVLDLHHRGPGVYYLAPAITLDHDLSLLTLIPSRLRVTITAPPATPTAIPTRRSRPTLAPTRTPRPTPVPTRAPRPRPTAKTGRT